MKKLIIAGLAGALSLGILAGCSEEAQQNYDKAGENISEGVQADAAKTENVVDAAGVTGKVKSALMAADGVDSEHINVDTMGKTVVLKGTVDSEAEKTKAGEIAKANVDADYSIDNQLTVGKSTTDVTINN